MAHKRQKSQKYKIFTICSVMKFKRRICSCSLLACNGKLFTVRKGNWTYRYEFAIGTYLLIYIYLHTLLHNIFICLRYNKCHIVRITDQFGQIVFIYILFYRSSNNYQLLTRIFIILNKGQRVHYNYDCSYDRMLSISFYLHYVQKIEMYSFFLVSLGNTVSPTISSNIIVSISEGRTFQ